MSNRPPYVISPRRLFHTAHYFWMQTRNGILSVLFPWDCPGCRTGLPFPAAICDDCRLQLKRVIAPYCAQCGLPFPPGWTVRRCADCRTKRSPLTRVRSVYPYEGLVRQMIRSIKYRGEGRLIGFFAEELFLLGSGLNKKFDAIVAVPMHRSREWQRRFNQAALLAAEYSRLSGIPVWNGLLKRKSTPPQSSLSNPARQRNLRDAFQCVEGRQAPGRVLLIDDVITTGATVSQCARVLRRAGAKRVYALSVARVLKEF